MEPIIAKIEALATDAGFDAIGFTRVEQQTPSSTMDYYRHWLDTEQHAGMTYLSRNIEVRQAPEQLLPGAQSIIVVAASYYPTRLQPRSAPQVAKYAHGRNYHKILPKALRTLAEQIHSEVAPHEYRVCVDTAPLFERHWAQQAGLGFIGRNKNLIIPRIGSFLFLGEILTTLSLPPSLPTTQSCLSCTKCIDHCPTGALTPTGLNANKCISYLTIEHRGEIPTEHAAVIGERLYGCDTCQDVCPYNSKPRPTTLFPPDPRITTLTRQQLTPFTEERYARLFHGTAVTRAKYEGMARNVRIYLSNNTPESP